MIKCRKCKARLASTFAGPIGYMIGWRPRGRTWTCGECIAKKQAQPVAIIEKHHESRWA